jgi:BirA family transcriptional regulator, biotin operon repressor / biotin---[acetyl-CoA-carboxylase] ligase
MAVSPLPLLRLLADGEFRSGRELGAALGVSRGAVWHRIRLAEKTGVRVFKVRGRGYRLSRPLDVIDADALAARAARLAPALSIEVLDECPSTSGVLVERAAAGAAHGSVVVCEHQTAGRGRRGNAWFSAIGGSLAFSLLWRFDPGPGALAGLSLAVAVLALRALEREGVAGVQLKWPNDLVCRGRKLGGILVELSGEVSGPSAAVIGIGLNVRLDAGARESIGRPVIDLAACSRSVPSRTALLAALLESLASGLARFGRDGFAPFRDEWVRHHAWQGRRVALSVAGRRVAEGEALGIAEDGSLMLRSPRGVERFHSGELSLRPA